MRAKRVILGVSRRLPAWVSVFLLAWFAPDLAWAEGESWVAIHSEPADGFDEPSAMAVGPQGTFAVTGLTRKNEKYDGRFVTSLMDIAGNTLWTTIYRPRDGIVSGPPRAIAFGPGGNIHVGGSVYFGSWDLGIVTYDAAGNEIWTCRWDGPDHQVDQLEGLAVDGSGTIYAVGSSSKTEEEGVIDMAVVKFSPDGEVLWSAGYDGVFEFIDDDIHLVYSADDYAGAIAVDGTGSSYATGMSIIQEWHETTAVTLKFGPDGSLLWSARLEVQVDAAPRIALDPSGDAVVAGTYPVALGGETEKDLFVVKYEADGAQSWAVWTDVRLDLLGPIASIGSGDLLVSGVGREPKFASPTLMVAKIGQGGEVLWVNFAPNMWEGGYEADPETPVTLAVGPSGESFASCGIDGGRTLTMKVDSDGNHVWRLVYPADGEGDVWPQAAIADAGDGLLLACSRKDADPATRILDDTDLAVIRIDGDGNLAWETRWNGEGNCEDEAQWAGADAGGNFYVAGRSYATDWNSDVIVARWDGAGNRSWIARWDGPDHRKDMLGGVAVDPSGNMSAACLSSLDDQWGSLTILRWDAGGNLAWTSPCLVDGEPGTYREPQLVLDGSGNVLVAAILHDTSSPTAVNRLIVSKYSRDGSLLWQATPDIDSDLDPHLAPDGIGIDGEGGIYISTFVSFKAGCDLLTLKLDALGNVLWTARYDSPERRYVSSRGMAVDPAGGASVLADTNMLMDPSITRVLRYDARGNLSWTYRLEPVGGVPAILGKIAFDGQGNWIGAGLLRLGPNSTSMLTMKLDPDGEVLWQAEFRSPEARVGATAIAVDRAGNVDVVGGTTDPSTIWTVRYGPSGDEIRAAMYAGSGFGASPMAIADDGEGNVLVAGYVWYPGSPPDILALHYSASGPAPATFIRGDCNGDGEATGSMTDAIFLLEYLFMGGGSPPCATACDADDTREVDIADPIFILVYQFLGGSPPPPPFPECGLAPEGAPGCDEAVPGCRTGG
jgi:hypothetical protein